MKYLFFILFGFYTFLFANVVENVSTDSICYDISVDSVELFKTDTFSILQIDGLGKLTKPNYPQIPGITKRIEDFSNYSVIVKYSDSIVYNNVDVIPAKKPMLISPNIEKQSPLIADSLAYNSKQFPVQWPLWHIRDIKLKSKIYSYIFITPVKYYPQNRQVVVYKKLSIVLKKNMIIKPCAIQSSAKNFLVITIDKYSNSADTLLLWKKLTGFNVQKLVKSHWSVSDVKSSVENFYNSNKNGENYVVLLGDIEDIESNHLSKDGEYFYSDNPYFCMDGSEDYVFDLYYGRVSVSSSSEAMSVIKKIVNYERSPSKNRTFYKTGVGAGYFSDGDDKDANGNDVGNDGYADRRFVQTIEDVKLHLDSLGYDIKRVYTTKNDVYPQYWNNGYYSFGEPVPDYLKKPNFKWDGDYKDILNYLNEGAFLLYHYDHGFSGGWADPAFYSSDINSLHNSGDLPLVLSINCLTGQFEKTECFAEKFLRHEDGGAVALVAASYLSYSGYNEAFLVGMIDDIWPKMLIKFPHNKNPQYTKHSSEYVLGKIFLDGLLSMEESWGTWSSYYTYQIYHIFGDPSTRIFTQYPKTLTINDFVVTNLDSNINLGEIDAKNGTAVLYNLNSQEVLSSQSFDSSVVSLSFQKQSEGDSLLLVVTGANSFPIMKKVVVKKGVKVVASSNDNSFGIVSVNDTNIVYGGDLVINVKANDGYVITSIVENQLESSSLNLMDTTISLFNIKENYRYFITFTQDNSAINLSSNNRYFSVGPNPILDKLLVYCKQSNMSVEVVNLISGNVVLDKNMKIGKNVINFNNEGSYSCRIYSDKKLLKIVLLTVSKHK